jgi:UDP-glucuronate 4-epimerase
MSILVTGAAGFIGSHVCEALLMSGESVVGLDSFDDFYSTEVKERNLDRARQFDSFTSIRGDIRDREFLERIPAGVEAVVHLAAKAGVRPSIESPEEYADVNVLGTQRLLAWTKRRGVRTFVFASSSSVYGNSSKASFSETDAVDSPISPYAATKRSGELLCRVAGHLDGLSVACLRFFTVYGPRQRPDLAIHKFARILSAGGEVPMFGDGSTSRDYTYIDDTVEGLLGALGWARDGEGLCDVFNLGNDRTVTLSEMISVLGAEMGVEAVIKQLGEQPGDVTRTCADITHARTTFGYRPRTEFRVGIRRFLDWYEGELSRGNRHEMRGTRVPNVG